MKTIPLALAVVAFLAAAVETRAEPRRTITINSGPTPTPAAVALGGTIAFSVNASTTVGPLLQYSWDFGDGTAVTPFVINNSTPSHAYATIGHFTVTVRVQDNPSVTVTATATTHVTVHYALAAGPPPTNSSTIILDSTNHHVWVVNPDQDTVTVLDAPLAGVPGKLAEIQVGKNPRTLAQAADGTIWVVSQQHPSISVLQPTAPYAIQHVIPLPHGSLPYGICMTPDGLAAYVSLQGSGGVQKFSTSSRGLLATSALPPSARGIAVTSNGRVLVTRFISPQPNPLLTYTDPTFIAGNHGEVVELNASLGVVRTFTLALDPGPLTSPDPDTSDTLVPPTSQNSRGVPNYLTSLVVTPDGRRAWVPSKKDNVQRGTGALRDGRIPSAELTYRAIVSSLDLQGNTAPLTERMDVDNSEMPQAACTSPGGDYLFVALQGNNRIQVRDLLVTPVISVNGFGDPSGTTATDGLSPQGLLLDPATNRLFIQNYMSRTVSVIDATTVLNGTSTTLPAPSPVISTVTGPDLLNAADPTVLRGKQVFYNASDPRMSTLGYISCAGCHLDGGSDMRVWDFTNRGEGFRNTIILQGRGGTGQGNVHWTANFNEIQDFDNDIYFHFHDGNPAPPGGVNSSFTTSPNPSMGASNAGRDPSGDLDALAAYVSSLTKVSRSPFRNPDGSLTASGARGEAVFKSLNCVQCHKGQQFTDSQVFSAATSAAIPAGAVHDVGTIKPSSGTRLGDAVTPLPGIDTPTLKGLWQTAPYFHDGSAAAIMDVINTVPNTVPTAHGSMHLLATQQQKDDLAEYLSEIDELDAPPVPVQTNTLTLGVISSGRPYSLGTAASGSLPFVDRSYTIATSVLTAPLSGKILLRTAEDDKVNATTSLISFTLTLAADVYVFYDSRATTLPAWLSAWGAGARSITEDLRITPGGTATGLLMQAYKMNFPAGPVTLGGNLQGGGVGALRNYFVIINQSGSPLFEEGPISKGEWAHDRDQDGDGLHDEYEVLKSLNPWVFNSVTALLPDEDKIVTGTTTAFMDQIAFETPPAGSGGCGLGGLEVLIPFAFFRFIRKANSRRRGIRTS